MALQLDNEQKQAVESLGSNILVSASAGAGKTGVLVQRLKKRVLVDKVRVSRILAMTFTQAAASEMKKRLALELHSAYTEADTEEMKSWILEQLIELEAADITTIDSFCLTIIKKYYSVIGLDPSTVTKILTEGSVNLFKKQAFYHCLNQLIEDDFVSAKELLEYFSSRSEDYDTLLKTVNNINNHAQSAIDPDSWYLSARDSYKSISKLSDLPNEIQEAFFQRLITKLNLIISYTQEMKEYGQDDEKVDLEDIQKKENLIHNCINALKEHKYGSYSSSLKTLAMFQTSAGAKENAEYKDVRKKQEEAIKKLLEENYDEKMLIQDHNELTHLCHTLIDLSKNTWNQFVLYKQKDACMDFTDMERYAYNILTVNNASISMIMKDLYDEIMVDEFQDTSDLQNAIIEMISNGHNVFRVGDVKQSIYRFRQAKPELMRNLMKVDDTHQITLRHNFRSMNSIVTFSNHLFERLMNVNGCKDSYSALDSVTIGSTRQEEDIVPVEFELIEVSKDEDTSEDSPTTKQLKAEWIAQKILSMKKEDPSFNYKDFSILVRSHLDKIPLRSAFEKYNIPYMIDAREGFYQSDLCQTILSMLRYMKDKNDMVSLLSVLTSEFYQFTDTDLATLQVKYHSLKEGIQQDYPYINEEMEELKQIGDKYGILTLLKEISIRHDFYNHLNDSQKANFDYLFEIVTTTRIDTLEDFLKTTEASEDERSSEAVSKGKDDDVVTVTTIHQSKGLQYPVVFLWSSMQNQFRDTSEAVMVDDTFKIGLYHISMPYRERRTTIQRMAVEYNSNLEDIEEFIRLLYVAITRAERRLFIVDATKKKVNLQPVDLTLLYQRKGMTPLILSAMKDDPYMKMSEVLEDDIEPATPIMKEEVTELPKLTIRPELLKELYTPSSTEFKELPELDESSKLAGSRYGTMIHETFATLPNTEWTMEDLKDYPLRDSDKQRILAFSKTDLYKEALTMGIHKEFPFYIETETERINGTMDFVAISDSKIILVDYKTDNADITEIKKRYTPQLKTYIKALHIMYPNVPVVAYAYSLHHSQLIEID